MFRRRAPQAAGNSSEDISTHVYVSPLLQSEYDTGYDATFVQTENVLNTSNEEQKRCSANEHSVTEAEGLAFSPKRISFVNSTETISENNNSSNSNDKSNLINNRSIILHNQSWYERHMESSESTLMRSYGLAPSLSFSSSSASSLRANTSPLVSARMPMPHILWAQRRRSLTY